MHPHTYASHRTALPSHHILGTLVLYTTLVHARHGQSLAMAMSSTARTEPAEVTLTP